MFVSHPDSNLPPNHLYFVVRLLHHCSFHQWNYLICHFQLHCQSECKIQGLYLVKIFSVPTPYWILPMHMKQLWQETMNNDSDQQKQGSYDWSVYYKLFMPWEGKERIKLALKTAKRFTRHQWRKFKGPVTKELRIRRTKQGCPSLAECSYGDIRPIFIKVHIFWKVNKCRFWNFCLFLQNLARIWKWAWFIKNDRYFLRGLFSRALYYMRLICFAYDSPHVESPKRVSYFFLSAPLHLLRIVEVAPFNLWLLFS